ncbi:MAG: DUF4296 domain-containing protein [Crocinitomicaceae bacterium]|nr:DUF4296 domain-containing protein [Crocinitomicaceae bacterium]
MSRFFIIAILVLMASCTDGINRFDEPDNLIPRDKMVEIMTDLVKLEAHIQSEYVSVARFHKVMSNSGDALLEEYDITLDQFDKSIDYYGTRQDEMQSIYNDALNLLNKELGELQQ